MSKHSHNTFACCTKQFDYVNVHGPKRIIDVPHVQIFQFHAELEEGSPRIKPKMKTKGILRHTSCTYIEIC